MAGQEHRHSPEEIVFWAMGPKIQTNPRVQDVARRIQDLALGAVFCPEGGDEDDRRPTYELLDSGPFEM